MFDELNFEEGVDVSGGCFQGKVLDAVRAQVCRVWMLVAIFWHGERVGMKA